MSTAYTVPDNPADPETGALLTFAEVARRLGVDVNTIGQRAG
jgi:hypothetical protein